MKSIFTSLSWLLFLVPVISLAGTTTNLDRAGDERTVSGFHGISSGGSWDVTVKLGNTESLRIEGDAETISQIETKVENGILKISDKSRSGWWKSSRGRVDIYITAKTLNSLSLSGSGSLKVVDELKTGTLSTRVSGSGSLQVSAVTTDFSASVSGSGSMTVSGRADHSTVSISGSGSFRGRDLRTSDASIRISGSGGASIAADNTLNTDISGSGSVRYSGNATVNSKKSGSGRVVKG